MRFYISYLSNWKFLKKINFGGLKSIFFLSSLLYFCIYFFYNIDQISFDINLEKNGIDLLISFIFCVLSIYLNAYAWKYIVKWFGEEFNNNKPEVENASASKSNTDDFIADTKRLLQLKPFLVTIISLVLIQFAYGVIMPVVPLFLQQLAGHAEIITEAGFIFSLMSLTGALSSALMGGWTERIGVKRMLFVGLVATALFLACQGSAESVMVFAVLQVMGGLATGAVRPVANTITTFVVAEEDLVPRGHGDILGFQQSGLKSFKYADPIHHKDLFSLAEDEIKKCKPDNILEFKNLLKLYDKVEIVTDVV